MEDQLNEQLREETQRERRGGPASPEGKARSSMNRLTHGCCSEKILVPDENPAELQATFDGWFEQYEFHDGIGKLLIHETALAHWLLKRARRRLRDVERELPANPNHWKEADEKRFDRHTRYKTTAERSFFRHFKELEAHFDRIVRDDNARRLANIKAAAIEMKWLNKEEEKTAEKLKVDQYVEVKVVDGECTTSCYPSNEQVIEEIARRPNPPIFMTRWILFPDGVPAEYDWCNPNEVQKFAKTHANQKMLYTQWLRAIEKEKATGHLGPVQIVGMRETK